MRNLVACILTGVVCLLAGAFYTSNRQASHDTRLRQQIEADLSAKEKAAEDAKAEALSERRKAVREAIIAVLNSQEAAWRECAGSPFKIHTYCDRLQEADVTRCTPAFQEAWTDMTAAWEEVRLAVDQEEQAVERSQRQRQRHANAAILEGAVALVAACCTGGSSLTIAGAHITAGTVATRAASAALSDAVQANKGDEPQATGNDYADKILEACAKVRKAAIAAGVVFHPRKGA
jgi:hypothetical protein